MASSYIGYGAASFGNNAALTPALHASTLVGDRLILLAGIREDGATVNTPSGWNLIGSFISTGYEMSIAAYWKNHDGSAMPSVTFTGGGSNDTTYAQVHTFRGDFLTPTIKASGLGDLWWNTQNFNETVPVDSAILLLGARSDDTATFWNGYAQYVVFYSGAPLNQEQTLLSQSSLGADMAVGHYGGIVPYTTPGSGTDFFRANVGTFSPDINHIGFIICMKPVQSHVGSGGVKYGGAAATVKDDPNSHTSTGGVKLGGEATTSAALNPGAPVYKGGRCVLLADPSPAPLPTGPYYAASPAGLSAGDLVVVEFLLRDSTTGVHASISLTNASGWTVLYNSYVQNSTNRHTRIVAWKVLSGAEAVQDAQLLGVTVAPGDVSNYTLLYALDGWSNYHPDNPVTFGGVSGPVDQDESKRLFNTATNHAWAKMVTHPYWDYSSYIFPTYSTCEASLGWTTAVAASFPDKLDIWHRLAAGPTSSGLSCTVTPQGIYGGISGSCYYAINGYSAQTGGVVLGGTATDLFLPGGSAGGEYTGAGGVLFGGDGVYSVEQAPYYDSVSITAWWSTEGCYSAGSSVGEVTVVTGGKTYGPSRVQMRRTLNSVSVQIALPGRVSVTDGTSVQMFVDGLLSADLLVSGHTANTAETTVDAEGPAVVGFSSYSDRFEFYRTSSGRLRLPPDPFLRPGDTYNGRTAAEVITYLDAHGGSFTEIDYGQSNYQ